MATGNFYFENRCIVVLNEDFENDNIPEKGDFDASSLRSFPSYFLEVGDKFNFWDIVLTSGYYEHACIDYKRSENSVENDLGCSWYMNTQKEFIRDAKSFYGLSEYRIRKVCGKVSECSDFDTYMERAYERLTDYLAEMEEKEVNKVLDKVKEEYGYEEYSVAWRASNGETAYRKVG